MLARVILHLLCSSESDARQVRDAIAQRVSTKPLRVTHSELRVMPSKSGGWAVHGDVSFRLRIDADDIRDDAVQRWSSGQLRNRILAGSTVSLHVCSHADGEAGPWEDCLSIDFQLSRKE
jgi:hypothetical protein